MLYIYIWLIIILIICFACFILFIFSQIKASNICNNNYKINSQVRNSLINQQFIISKQYIINDNYTTNAEKNCKQTIYVDSENDRIAFINYNSKKLNIIDFKDIINYEIYQNGEVAYAGCGTGTIFGGVFLSKTNNICKDLYIMIRINSISNPQITYKCIYEPSFIWNYNKNSEVYKDSIKSLQNIISLLEVIISNNKKQ